MSCSVILQNDWLEYENGLSVWSKIAAVIMMAVGSTLLYYQIKIEKTISSSLNTPVALTTMLKILQSLCAVIIVIPIVFLFFSVMPTKNVAPFPLIFIGAIILCVISLAVVVLVAGIQIEIGKMNISFPTFVWLPTSVLAAASILFLIYRYKSRENISIPKQHVMWKNIRQNVELIETIGKKQSGACGIKIPEGESVNALVYHIQQRGQEYNKKSFFSKLFSPNEDDDVNPDKVPNIMKMYANMMQDADDYEEDQRRRSSRSRDGDDYDDKPGILSAVGNAYNNLFTK